MTKEADVVKRFQEVMSTFDDVALLVLKGHLILEQTISNIVDQFLFHPEVIANSRLSFHQKMLLARSLCLRKYVHGEWELIAGINTLRNDLAHNLDSPERAKKLQKIRELFLREASGFEVVDSIRHSPDREMVIYACGHSLGYLNSCLSDAKAFRRLVHSMDRNMNPDLPEFAIEV